MPSPYEFAVQAYRLAGAAAAAASASMSAAGDVVKALEEAQPLPPPPPTPQPPPPPVVSPLLVGLDVGGWTWQAAINDWSQCVRHVRSDIQHWSSDVAIGQLATAGVTLLPLYNHGGSIISVPAAGVASTVANWYARYGKGGTFWASRADMGPDHVEVINEPDNPFLGRARGEAAAYAAVLQACVAATAQLPAPPLILASYDGGYAGDQYGAEVASHGGFNDPRVQPTVHPYGGHGSIQSSGEGNRARITQAHTDLGRPVHVTEVGWPTAVGQPATGDSLQWTEQQQVENMTAFHDWCASLGYVGTLVFFNYADYGTNNWYGVVKPAGSPHKLSFNAVKAMAGL